MNIAEALISGIVQGITEFFPISSSGHLVMLHSIFGMKEPQLAFDIFLHLGTLVSVLIFFWKDILRILTGDRRTLILVIVGSIPAFVIGFFFKDNIERLFGMPKTVGYMLIVTGIWLILASVYSMRINKIGIKRPLNVSNSFIIGIAQAIAVIPGISRSGSTIATGLLMGLDREAAFRFSFLLSIPAIFGASILKAGHIGTSLVGSDLLYFAVGGVTAMLVGLIAIKMLLKLIKNDLFYIFGIYCLIVGSIRVVL